MMRREEGQAFILVLILLAVGALLIVPVLNFTGTGLRAERVYEDRTAQRYSADSALEDALWRMLNGGLLSSLDPANPVYQFQFNPTTSVDIKIPTIQASVWVQQSSYRAKVDVQPNWLEGQPSGTPTFVYVVRIDQQQWDLVNYGFDLPANMHYVPNSTNVNPETDEKTTWNVGPEKYTNINRDAVVSPDGMQYQNHTPPWDPGQPGISLPDYPGITPDQYLTISTAPDGRERLTWNPPAWWGAEAKGRRVLIQTIAVEGNPGWGVHYIEPWFNMIGGVSLLSGPTGALGVAMYNILMDVGGVTYQVVVAYDSTTGGMKIVSYQVVP